MAITLICIAFVFRFPNALGRLIESCRDFGLSLVYYFCELFGFSHNIEPTVNNFAKIPFFSFLEGRAPSAPNIKLPWTWEEFKPLWKEYWRTWASGDNFYLYMLTWSYYALLIAQFLSVILWVVLLVYLLMNLYLKNENNNYNEDSRSVRVFRWITFKAYLPVKRWCAAFIGFVKERRLYWKTWLIIWLFYFNVITAFIEFISWYLYFAVAFDFKTIYTQVYKLIVDLYVPVTFIPVWLWFVIGFIIFDKIRKNIGYSRLNHFERRNRGFIKERPIVSMICATMGKGKTTQASDMAISCTVMFRDKALEMILENDLKFPQFPWINFENELKTAMNNHDVYNLATAKRYVRNLRARWDDDPTSENLFGYDVKHYPVEYDDGLKIESIWDVLENYAQLYLIYVTQSSLIIANYSIRTDDILSDLGNFPLWNSEFFKRDSRLAGAFSRHAKILDFDSVRLGLKMVKDSATADSFEFGVVVITEIGKERGNNLENREKKKATDEVNQKNDLFNSWLKMVRHSATVDGFPFVKVLTDEQRPESWGADARDLCEIVHIRERGERQLAMPFFALTELLYSFVFNRFVNLYLKYRHNRGDNTLPMLTLKLLTSKLQAYYTRIYNRFGFRVLSGEIERGTQDGELREYKYFLMDKKIYSKRFSTDCFSDYFAKKSLRSPVGLDDLPEYETERASFDELAQQNSYFVNDLLNGMKG